MSETVSFDKQGGYQFGTPISEMDVQAGKDTKKLSNVQMHLPPQAGSSTATPTVQPRGAFNLNALRQQAAAPAPTAEPEVQEAPAQVSPTVKDSKDGDTSSSPVEEVPAPAAEQTVAEPVKPETFVSVAEETSTTELTTPQVEEPAPTPRSGGISLESLGLSRSSEAQSTQGADMGTMVSVGEVKRMNLADSSSTQSEEVAEDVPSAVAPSGVDDSGTSATSTEVEAMNFTEETPFEVVRLTELLSMLMATESSFVDWLGHVVKAYSKAPTSVFSWGAHPNMRAYSISYPFTRGKQDTLYVTVGVGKKITTCAYNSKRHTVIDASGEISVSGTCAIVQDTPVASCSQRTRTAQRL